MNYLLQNRNIDEMNCGGNIAYVLDINSDFSSIEYKVLQNQNDSFFIRCMKNMYNSKVQLYYLTNSLKPLSAILPGMDHDSFIKIVENLLTDIIEIKNIGFLHCQNIDISFDRIFIDLITYKVSLVYLPLVSQIYPDYHSFENELRSNLIKAISSNSTLSGYKTIKLKDSLQNNLLTIEEILSGISTNLKGGLKRTPIYPHNHSDRMKLVAIDAPSYFEIVVDKPEFLIGKKENSVDGVVPYNKYIGRVHCKLTKIGGQYYISDLESVNGTFVNDSRLSIDAKKALNDGDIVKLANSEFKVVMY